MQLPAETMGIPTPLMAEVATTVKTLENVLACGAKFLIHKQGDEGAWRDFYLGVGVGSQWVTGYVCHMTADLAALSTSHHRAIEWLKSTVKSGGGWGFNEDVPADGDSTANVLLCMRLFPELFSKELQDETTAFLAAYFSQNKHGGCSTYLPIPQEMRTVETSMIRNGSGWCAAHPSVTALAIEAMLETPEIGAESKTLQTAVKYLSGIQNDVGFWPAYWWDGYMYATNRAARVFHQFGMLENVNPAIEWLIGNILSDGGWNNGVSGDSSAFHTALAIQTLSLAQPGPKAEDCIHRGLEWLYSNQRETGEWSSSLPLMHITNPGIHEPWKHEKNTAMGLVFDRENIFTTATVLNALHSAKQCLKKNN